MRSNDKQSQNAELASNLNSGSSPNSILSARPLAALCVSIHDVAPETWPQCERLLRAVRAVAAIPLTWLVVPAYHRSQEADTSLRMQRVLDQRLAAGDALALHGLSHLDEGPTPQNWRQRFIRRVYTASEGEFSAIDAAEARRRIDLGLAWFKQRDWPAAGFVAPAWLLGAGAWNALRDYDFQYTTTLRYFYALPSRRTLYAPSLVYAARNSVSQTFSRCRNRLLMHNLVAQPLVRFGLHPADAAYPELLRDMQRRLERLLLTRTAMTKNRFVQRWEESVRSSAQHVACYQA